MSTIAGIAIDIFGIIAGSIALVFALKFKMSTGGKLGDAIIAFMAGVVMNLSALLYALIFTELKLLPPPFQLEIHPLLMTFGLILFTFSAYKFISLSRP